MVVITDLKIDNLDRVSIPTKSGPMDLVFDIKSGHDFSRYRNSIQVICFQINGGK